MVILFPLCEENMERKKQMDLVIISLMLLEPVFIITMFKCAWLFIRRPDRYWERAKISAFIFVGELVVYVLIAMLASAYYEEIVNQLSVLGSFCVVLGIHFFIVFLVKIWRRNR